MANFTDRLLSWYPLNQRDLPWRKTDRPYAVWLSEIILQQTQIAQGKPYYERFIEAYPTVFDLAKASEHDVLKLWQGLGYYSRARNLHHTAQVVAFERNGVFPRSYEGLKKLKGVGDYTASAIASICYNEPVAALDGNVFRVLSRFFGIATPINVTEGRKLFKEKADLLLDRQNPGRYNEALMEFGAVWCKPKRPLCHDCPLKNDCVAFQQGKVGELPVKLKKTKIRKRFFNYLVFVSNDGDTLLQQRTGKGIWQNLYEFPLLETPGGISKDTLLENPAMTHLSLDSRAVEICNATPVKHQLSHQKLMVTFWRINIDQLPTTLFERRLEVVGQKAVTDYAVPVVIEKFLNKFDF